jgi:hypothetical protein
MPSEDQTKVRRNEESVAGEQHSWSLDATHTIFASDLVLDRAAVCRINLNSFIYDGFSSPVLNLTIVF